MYTFLRMKFLVDQMEGGTSTPDAALTQPAYSLETWKRGEYQQLEIFSHSQIYWMMEEMERWRNWRMEYRSLLPQPVD